eukprot:EC823562.1.p1 GENE.EC823562.1~~EC823562.1.p1  ORF type:complete len:202 (+),score=53.76 EC823562.1:43-648(+)
MKKSKNRKKKKLKQKEMEIVGTILKYEDFLGDFNKDDIFKQKDFSKQLFSFFQKNIETNLNYFFYILIIFYIFFDLLLIISSIFSNEVYNLIPLSIIFFIPFFGIFGIFFEEIMFLGIFTGLNCTSLLAFVATEYFAVFSFFRNYPYQVLNKKDFEKYSFFCFIGLNFLFIIILFLLVILSILITIILSGNKKKQREENNV